MDNQTNEQPQELSTQAPQQTEPVSTSNPQEQQVSAPQQEISGEAAMGEIVEEKPKHAGGRPSKYSDEMVQKAQHYLTTCWDHWTHNKQGEKVRSPKIPFIEELQMELSISDETINEWSKNDENGEPLNPEFSAAIKQLKILQRLALQKRSLGNTNPTGAIFLLKVNHGMVETEKRILAGERNGDPMQLTINEYTPGQKAIPPEVTAKIDQLSE